MKRFLLFNRRGKAYRRIVQNKNNQILQCTSYNEPERVSNNRAPSLEDNLQVAFMNLQSTQLPPADTRQSNSRRRTPSVVISRHDNACTNRSLENEPNFRNGDQQHTFAHGKQVTRDSICLWVERMIENIVGVPNHALHAYEIRCLAHVYNTFTGFAQQQALVLSFSNLK
jgi:hypothetical protein